MELTVAVADHPLLDIDGWASVRAAAEPGLEAHREAIRQFMMEIKPM